MFWKSFIKWNLWSYLVNREMKFLFTRAMYFLWFYSCYSRLKNAFPRLLIVVVYILFHNSDVFSRKSWLKLTLAKAELNYSLISSGVDLTHLALIYSFFFFSSSSFSSFYFFSFSSCSFHSFCLALIASISSTFAWTFHYNAFLSQFPSIYSQHLAETGSSEPNLVPNS